MDKSDATITRKYSVSEIDLMRALLPNIMFPTIWWSRSSGHTAGGSYNQTDRQKEIEERLRTYLMAGVSLEELEEESREVADRSEEQRLSIPEETRHD